MKKIILILLFIPAYISAQDQPVDENALFSEDNIVIDNKIQDNTSKDEMDARSLGFSGSITAAFRYAGFDDSSLAALADEPSFRPYMVGGLYLDARMPGGYKGFGSFELLHDASVDEEATGEKQTTVSMNELFVDFNFARHVYFRTGKQVLQWGQCYLWNPTDMINIENKHFIESLEQRQGTYGVRMHIPFGTVVNIYGFAGMNNVDSAKDISGAGKFEFLISKTEMAFSAWGKRNYNPVYGYDFSGRFLTIDIRGEASYSHGSNTMKAVDRSGTLYAERDEDADIFKAALNIARDFDFGEKADRINVSVEFFYNGDGYRDNPIEDTQLYTYDNPVVIPGMPAPLAGGDMKTYIIGNGMYQPNYLSMYYGALFVTVREFIISDITLTLNGISNIQHRSFIASTAMAYSNINNFNAGISANFYAGSREGEYRASGNEYDVQVTTGIVF